jgi:hypothetical protein
MRMMLVPEGFPKVHDSAVSCKSGSFALFGGFRDIERDISAPHRMKPFISCALAALVFSGCVQQIAVSTVGGIVDDGFEGFTEESDLEFARDALPGNLKLIDVLLKSEPDNERLLRLASQGYNSYALAFLEDSDPDRARAFYLRGRDQALKILRTDEDVARALSAHPDSLRDVLRTTSESMVPAAFWAAFGWGSYIYLSLDNPDAVADLPRAEALMQFVADRDSSYYYAGADLFLGMLYGSRSRMLGGDPVKSRNHFERALRTTERKFLMAQLYYARSYATQNLDEELFDRLIAEVENTSLEVLPENRLANAVAKRKAALLKARKSELF